LNTKVYWYKNWQAKIMLETIESGIFSLGGSCDIDGTGHCVTCSDEALPAKVLKIDLALALAVVEIAGQVTEVDISLVDEVVVGRSLLVHGGVALEHVSDERPGV
jgi:hydrogenase maturation factor